MDRQLYEQLKQQYTDLKSKEDHKLKLISSGRLVAALFLLALGSLAVYYSELSFLYGALAALAVFILLVKISGSLKKKIKLFQNLIQINQNELNVINGEANQYHAGEQYIDSTHPFTYDLDIFGTRSLFHAINRTGTTIGRDRLANLFTTAKQANISESQAAIKELAQKVNWRQLFFANALLVDDKDIPLGNLKEWAASPNKFKHNFRFVFIALSAVCLAALAAIFFVSSSLPTVIFVAALIVNTLIVKANLKYIEQEHEIVSEANQVLSMYAQLLELIEKEEFSSYYLNSQKEKLKTTINYASSSINRLAKLLHQLDSMHNGLGSLILNGFFLYHMHTLLSLEKWKKESGKCIKDWFEVISELEALNSIANYSFNNPDFTLPELIAEEALEIENLGHPLIPAGKRICNNLNLKENKFIILTGSNMAGKSTFLRTVGINLILARIGAPVCAAKFRFYPFDVFATMRINDSLQDNESFFYAELKRLQQIMQHLQKGNKTFVLLDEILRGTNSNDKREGTKGLIRKMVEMKTLGVFATHDISISQMEQEYAGYLVNKCFEVEIVNDELYFDYKLKNGVCQKMSAAFLMKKMGII